MSALIAVGIALVGLGALVLLRFPDRPGGKVAWRGLEVSSTGAGLPVIALGLVAVTVGVLGPGGAAGRIVVTDGTGEVEGSGDGGDGTVEVGGCLGPIVAGVDADRIANVHSGAHDQDVIGPTQTKRDPVAMVLHESGEPIGAVVVRFFAESGVFDVAHVVDAGCRPVDGATSSGDVPDKVPNWGSLRIPLEQRLYELDLGGSDVIRVSFHEVVD